jgi:hypothetical protein
MSSPANTSAPQSTHPTIAAASGFLLPLVAVLSCFAYWIYWLNYMPMPGRSGELVLLLALLPAVLLWTQTPRHQPVWWRHPGVWAVIALAWQALSLLWVTVPLQGQIWWGERAAALVLALGVMAGASRGRVGAQRVAIGAVVIALVTAGWSIVQRSVGMWTDLGAEPMERIQMLLGVEAPWGLSNFNGATATPLVAVLAALCWWQRARTWLFGGLLLLAFASLAASVLMDDPALLGLKNALAVLGACGLLLAVLASLWQRRGLRQDGAIVVGLVFAVVLSVLVLMLGSGGPFHRTQDTAFFSREGWRAAGDPARTAIPAFFAAFLCWLILSPTRGLARFHARAPRLLRAAQLPILLLLIAVPAAIQTRITISGELPSLLEDNGMGGHSTVQRIAFWRNATEAFLERPIAGHGLAGAVDVMNRQEYSTESWLAVPSFVEHAHNEYLEILLDGGLINAAILLMALVLTLAPLWRRREHPLARALLCGWFAWGAYAALDPHHMQPGPYLAIACLAGWSWAFALGGRHQGRLRPGTPQILVVALIAVLSGAAIIRTMQLSFDPLRAGDNRGPAAIDKVRTVTRLLRNPPRTVGELQEHITETDALIDRVGPTDSLYHVRARYLAELAVTQREPRRSELLIAAADDIQRQLDRMCYADSLLLGYRLSRQPEIPAAQQATLVDSIRLNLVKGRQALAWVRGFKSYTPRPQHQTLERVLDELDVVLREDAAAGSATTP